ncbi:MAG: hypothetical protein QM740_13560 [Acidovorax sp.]
MPPSIPLRYVIAIPYAALTLTAALAMTAAQAQPFGAPRGLPPEAYTACQGKAEGASVTITLPDGKTMDGTCKAVDGKLAALPSGAPPAPPAR